MSKHKYSTLALILFGVIFSIAIVSSLLTSDDIDQICDENNSTLFRYDGTWMCGSLSDVTINYTTNNITYLTNNYSLWSNDSLHSVSIYGDEMVGNLILNNVINLTINNSGILIFGNYTTHEQIADGGFHLGSEIYYDEELNLLRIGRRMRGLNSTETRAPPSSSIRFMNAPIQIAQSSRGQSGFDVQGLYQPHIQFIVDYENETTFERARIESSRKYGCAGPQEITDCPDIEIEAKDTGSIVIDGTEIITTDDELHLGLWNGDSDKLFFLRMGERGYLSFNASDEQNGVGNYFEFSHNVIIPNNDSGTSQYLKATGHINSSTDLCIEGTGECLSNVPENYVNITGDTMTGKLILEQGMDVYNGQYISLMQNDNTSQLLNIIALTNAEGRVQSNAELHLRGLLDVNLSSSLGEINSIEKHNFEQGALVQGGNGRIVSTNAGGGLEIQTESGDPGYISFGNTADIGISSDGVEGNNWDTDGTLIFKQKASNPDGLGEFVFLEEAGDWRFGLPSSGGTLGTYNPRSMIIAGPSLNNDTNFYCTAWGAKHIDCNTSTTGADLFVDDSVEIGNTLYVQNNISFNKTIDIYTNGNQINFEGITGSSPQDLWFDWDSSGFPRIGGSDVEIGFEQSYFYCGIGTTSCRIDQTYGDWIWLEADMIGFDLDQLDMMRLHKESGQNVWDINNEQRDLDFSISGDTTDGVVYFDAQDENLEILEDHKICLDGSTCAHYIVYNGTDTIWT